MANNRRKLYYYTSFIISISIGAMQAYRVKGGILTNYGADFFGPAWFYWTQRVSKPGRLYRAIISKEALKPLQLAVLVFSLCLVWEICQLFDWSGTILAITRGRFDWLDICAYAASLGICYFMDKRLERNDQ